MFLQRVSCQCCLKSSSLMNICLKGAALFFFFNPCTITGTGGPVSLRWLSTSNHTTEHVLKVPECPKYFKYSNITWKTPQTLDMVSPWKITQGDKMPSDGGQTWGTEAAKIHKWEPATVSGRNGCLPLLPHGCGWWALAGHVPWQHKGRSQHWRA